MNTIANKRIAREEEITKLMILNDFEWKEKIASQIDRDISDQLFQISSRIKNAINKGLTEIKND